MTSPEHDAAAGPNAAQIAYWNDVAGPKWTGLGAAIDARMAAVQDLLIASAGVKPGQSVLDVGCGMGTTTLACADRVGVSGQVVGIDVSTPMLEVARRRVAERGFANVSLLEADAQTYRFAAQCFDRIVSRFGVMFFADPVAAFRNLQRAMRPGARLSFVCWAPLAENAHWRIPLEIVSQALGAPVAEPEQTPGPLALSDVTHLRDILEGAGFHGAKVSTEAVFVIGTAPEEEARLACHMGPSARLVQERVPSEAVHDAICRRIAEALSPYVSGGKTILPASVHLVTAERAC